MDVRRALGIGVPKPRNGGDGPDFPPPKPRATGPTFNPGDSVIVTTDCEDIALHELTGQVTGIARTGSVIVALDVDGSHLPFRPTEIGHRY